MVYDGILWYIMVDYGINWYIIVYFSYLEPQGSSRSGQRAEPNQAKGQSRTAWAESRECSKKSAKSMPLS